MPYLLCYLFFILNLQFDGYTLPLVISAKMILSASEIFDKSDIKFFIPSFQHLWSIKINSISHTADLFFEALWDQHSIKEGEVQVKRMVCDPNRALLAASFIRPIISTEVRVPSASVSSMCGNYHSFLYSDRIWGFGTYLLVEQKIMRTFS